MKFVRTFAVWATIESYILFHSSAGGRSHIKGMLEVGQTLAERGHSVRYVATEDNMGFSKGHANISQVSLGHKGLFKVNLLGKLDSECSGKLGEDYGACFGRVAMGWAGEAYRHEYIPLMDHVNQETPELMVCDLFAGPCHEIAEANGIPLVIGIQALDWLDLFNMPYITKDPRFVPLTIEGMSIPGKMFDTLVAPYGMEMFWSGISSAINQERQRVGSKADWAPKGAFHYGIGLSNSFFGFEVAQHLPPNIRAVGPILSTSFEPMDEPLLSFLDARTKVMFVGFGSILSLQEPEITKIYFGAQEAMDQGHIDGVIWGLGRTSLSQFPNVTDDRILIQKWAPQQSILNHPSTILFLSHGGMESSFEALHSATAILNIPFFADQARNSAKLQELGVGLYIDPKALDIAASIKALLSRPDLNASLAKSKALTRSHNRRRHEAANYIEDHLELALACRPHHPYISGGGTPPCELSHLLPASARLGFVQANRLDVYLIILGIPVTILVTFGFFMSSLLIKTFKARPHPKSD